MIRNGLACVAVMALSLSVQAQSNVGEVLDAGGSQLSKEELFGLLRGASISGPSENGNQTQADLKADGEITGSFQRSDGKTGNYFGKWSVDDQGRFCRDIKTTFRNSSTMDSACYFYFKAGERYFTAETTERTAVLLPRNIAKK